MGTLIIHFCPKIHKYTKIKKPKTDIIMSYSNDAEYRQYFRNITGMRNAVYHHEPGHINLNESIPDDMDDTTLDEYLYDEEAVTKTLSYIYDLTKNDARFQELYDLAAARMISMDREIGLTILMTYDYLALFYSCFTEFIDGKDFDDGFKQLKKSLIPNRG